MPKSAEFLLILFLQRYAVSEYVVLVFIRYEIVLCRTKRKWDENGKGVKSAAMANPNCLLKYRCLILTIFNFILGNTTSSSVLLITYRIMYLIVLNMCNTRLFLLTIGL